MKVIPSIAPFPYCVAATKACINLNQSIAFFTDIPSVWKFGINDSIITINDCCSELLFPLLTVNPVCPTSHSSESVIHKQR